MTSPRHGSLRYLPVQIGPHRPHVLHGESTQGAGVKPLVEHGSVARLVKEVGARGDVGSVSTGVNVFHADWAVVVGSVGDTFVWQVFRKAETTGLTVEELVPSSDPAAQLSHITPRREFLSAVS